MILKSNRTDHFIIKLDFSEYSDYSDYYNVLLYVGDINGYRT